jgi:hypothetical protein
MGRRPSNNKLECDARLSMLMWLKELALMSPYVLPYVSYSDLRCLVLSGRVGSSEDNEARFVFDG